MPSIFDELTGKPGDQEELNENEEQERELEDLEIDVLDMEDDDQPVSYTHLTLPTNREV